ncbi:Transmembrane nucleoporin [Mycoemilia scoparia]|uniref:Transmembrane nucleoporin n=1 Tax=Mycoemilia scoparia TaxID=417184 RepID=A0A9W8DHQ7_9FUNG|nr:Transmembrane nucleoporin [Mycoemilia scoparia]
MPTAPPSSLVPLSDRLLNLAKEAQFSWWLGHVIVLVFGLLYYIRRPFDAGAESYYYCAYVGAFVSYVIVIYKTYGPPQINIAFLQRMILDENVQYFALAFYWWTQPTIYVSLLPFVVFSLFHSIGYLRRVVIPVFYPNVANEIKNATTTTKSSSSSSSKDNSSKSSLVDLKKLSLPAKVSTILGDWYNKYYLDAFSAIALWEVAIIELWLLLGALTFQTPFLAPLVYGQFLRFRYQLSLPTRNAFGKVRITLDKYLNSPQVPESVSSIYISVRDFLIRTGDQITNTQPRASSSSSAGSSS